MTPALINTAYMPPLHYIAAISRVSDVYIEIMETYRKQTCRNHCSIYGPNGKQTLTIPVIKVNGNHTLTKDIRISRHQPWQKIHWRSIKTAYNNSPFFLYYKDYFAPFYEKPYEFLIDFNFALLEQILSVLKIPVNLHFTETFKKVVVGYDDLREKLVDRNTDLFMPSAHYTQVFEPSHGFLPGLSILDVIFNLGPESASYLIILKTG
ncbi:MAG: WbqC family protein [Bacteroidetes bacterium]|nr:WbqC family protein [Bacteroidota bacterium]